MHEASDILSRKPSRLLRRPGDGGGPVSDLDPDSPAGTAGKAAAKEMAKALAARRQQLRHVYELNQSVADLEDEADPAPLPAEAEQLAEASGAQRSSAPRDIRRAHFHLGGSSESDVDDELAPAELSGAALQEYRARQRALRRARRDMGQFGDALIAPVEELRLQEAARRRAQLVGAES
ncbi:hypothetical protein HaLaN_06050, partial [Haematococcus lacustris]